MAPPPLPRAPASAAMAPTPLHAYAAGLHAPADAIDENLLLAETEELLAALDATAFIASPVTTEDDEDDGDFDDTSSRASPDFEQALTDVSATAATAPVAAAAAHSAIVPVTTGKKRVRSRDRTKDELIALRQTVAELEQHLVALRRSTSFVGKGKRHITQTWGHIAKRQERDRERAEAENAQLKAMLLAQLSVAGRFDHSSNKRQLIAIPDRLSAFKEPPPLPSDRQASPPSDTAMDALIADMDVHYAQMDAVFAAAGIAQEPYEPQSYAQTKTTARGESYLELVEVRLIPFHVRAVGTYMWESMKSWHYKSSTCAYTCLDRPADTFAVSYYAQSRQSDALGKYSAAFKLVKRRYVRSEHEIVVVWKSRSDGDKGLAGVSATEVGWLALTHVPAIDNHTPATTALRACVHIFSDSANRAAPGTTQGDGSPRKLLTSLVVDSFEEDVNSINQEMENLLLQDALATSTSSGPGTDDTSSTVTLSATATAAPGRLRFPMIE